MLQLFRFPVGLALLVAFSSFAAAERVERGALRIEGIPAIPEVLEELTRPYANVRSASLQSWLPDGSMLVGTRLGETVQTHRLAAPGAARYQLTFRDEPVRGAYGSRHPQHPGFLFSSDIGGSEFNQFYWMDSGTGREQLITDGTSRNISLLGSNRGDRFVYMSTRRTSTDYDLYLADIADPAAATLLSERTGFWMPLDWSPDDTRLLLSEYRSVNESFLEIFDLESGERTPVNPQPAGVPSISYRSAVWAADGEGFFFVSDEESAFRHLRFWDLRANAQEVLTGDIPWDVEHLVINAERSTLAFVVNDGGRSVLYLMDAETRERTLIESIPLGTINGIAFSLDDSQLGFQLSTPRTPGDVYSLDLKTRRLERWTESELGGLDSEGFVEPELIAYPTFDEIDEGTPRQIPAWVYRPEHALEAEPVPVVILIHGGPEAQSRPGFSSAIQLFVRELGAAVLVPNVRGSSGYGKAYLDLDNGYLREDAVRDIGALIDWIGTRPELDARRVVTYGGSYGGYMVLASLTHYSDRLAGGINVVGISHFVTFLENTQAYRRDLRRVEYGDERDPEMRAFLERISPLNQVDRITRPMLIVQGYNDPRVPVSEAEQIVASLKEQGAEPWYLLAMNEGHGFRRKENADYLRNVITLFLRSVFESDPD